MSIVTFPDPDQFDLSAQPEPEGVPTLQPPPGFVPPPAVAAQQADKYSFALGAQSPGATAIKDQIGKGESPLLRQVTAREQAYRQHEAKLKVIDDLSKRGTGPLSDEEKQLIMGVQNFPVNVDPESVLEKLYGYRLAKVASQSELVKDTVSAWEAYNPKAARAPFDYAADLIANNEIALKLQQELNTKWDQLGFGSKTWSTAQSLVPFLQAYRLHEPSGAVLPGTNLNDRIRSLLQLKPEDFEKAVRELTEELWAKNPADAIKLVDAIRTYTTDAGFADDMWTAIDVVSIFAPVGRGVPKPRTGLMRFDQIEAARKGTTNLRDQLYPGYLQQQSANRGYLDDVVDNIILATKRTTGEAGPPRTFNPLDQSDLNAWMAQKYGNPLSPAPFRAERMSGRQIITPDDRSWGDLNEAAKNIVRASSLSVEHRPEYIQAAVGEIAQSARVAVAREGANISRGDPPTDMPTFVARLPGVLNVTDVVKNPGTIAAQAATKVSNILAGNLAKLEKARTDHALFNRVSDEALAAAFKETETKMNNFYGHPSASVVRYDYNYGIEQPNRANVNSVTMVLGDKKGNPFKNENAANFAAQVEYKLGTGNYEIKKEAGGWFLRVTDPIDETTHNVFDHMITTTNVTPVSPLNMFLGALRTSQSLLSYLNIQARNVTTHGQQFINRAIADVAENIGKLNKTEHKRLKRMFELDQHYERDGEIGRYLNNISEFEQEYHRLFHEIPSEKEIAAYFSYRQIMDFDYDIRNLSLYRDKSRLGVKQHRFRIDIPETALEPKRKVYTDYFDGRVVSEIPSGNAGIWYQRADGSGTYLRTYQLQDQSLKTEIEEALANGHKIIQIFNPLERPLHGNPDISGHGGDIIHYVLAKDVSTQPLPMQQIPYRPGGHREYATQNFVKQAVISRAGGRHNYEGDITVFGFETEAEARKYVRTLNEAREMLKKGMVTELRTFLDKNLPTEFEFGRFQKYFKEHGGQWDIDEPFVFTPNHKSVHDMNASGLKGRYADFYNEHNSQHNLMNQIDRSFLGQRDPKLWTIKERGSEQQPLFELGSARLIDPLATLSRTVTNSANARLVSDYKHLSVSSWIQQAAPVLDIDPDLARSNPMYALHNAKWKKGVDDQLVATMKYQRLAIMNFMNMDTPDVRGIKYLQNKLVNQIYERMGQSKSDYVAEHLLSGERDPTRYARGIAFHSKLGLFNPAQFFVQAHAALHSIAVAGPVNGIRGLAGATLQRGLYATENPSVIAHFDKMATRLGWRAGDLTESHNALKRSGWGLVQGETAWADDVRDPKLFRSLGGRILDAGAVFFREGEKVSRLTAWNTAFLEWRAKNAGVRTVNDKALAEIISRADLLNVNMTRASKSAAEFGLMSLPTQFLSYQIRLSEQLLGGVVGAGKQLLGRPNNARLTLVETARAIATYSALYGLPVGVGATLGVWPFHDSIRQAAIEQGYDTKNPTFQAIMEGFPSWAMSMITGKEYNYAARVGPQGNTTFRDFLKGDKKWYELLGGVSASVIADLADPIYKGFYAGMTTGGIVEDAFDATKEISSVNNTLKAVFAWNYGKFYTKSGTPVVDADKFDAVMIGVFGLTPQAAADTFLKADSLKIQREAQAKAELWIKNEIRQAFKSGVAGESADVHRRIARAREFAKMGNFQPHQFDRIFNETMIENGDLKSRMDQQFFRNAPYTQKDDRTQQYIKEAQ